MKIHHSFSVFRKRIRQIQQLRHKGKEAITSIRRHLRATTSLIHRRAITGEGVAIEENEGGIIESLSRSP